MIFNDLAFLFIFLPAVLAVFFLPPLRGLRPWTLLFASFVFYGLSGLEHAIALAAGIVWVYLVSGTKGAAGNRWRLAAAIVMPALALFYYKYTGFLIASVLGIEASAGTEFSLFRDVVLPAGISFFTFQLIAFAIDRYRGDIPTVPRFGLFALYVSFFPQLVAGPILRYHEIDEPLHGLPGFRLEANAASRAIALIALGLAAKVLVADTLHHYITGWRAEPGALGSITAVYVLFAYSFQIYFDFYGYSLVAIGLGLLFGFSFPDNFRRPYEALNPRDFWRRWHRTLSYWIRDYLYIPLGGNERYRRNIVIIFAACGLWHGAGWTFVIWGLYHAVLVLGYHASAKRWDKLPRLAQIALTFVLVSAGWTLFMFDFAGIAAFARSLAGLGTASLAGPGLEHWAFLALAAAMCFIPSFEAMARRAGDTTRASLARAGGYAFLSVAVMVFIDRSQDFIYFRF
ncbi:MAG: MBOAT family protein [Alphaproteobacteria bacterium]|nr:MBOAT family protein [Alphaproteobacteria bacterium]